MGLIRATLGGLIGASIGAFVWILIAPIIPFVPGIPMMLVGFLAGMGVQKGWGDQELTIFHGLVAATCAITAIVGSRYLDISNDIKAAKSQLESYEPSREDIVALIASDMVAEIEDKGQKVEAAPVASLTPQAEIEINASTEKTEVIDSSWPTDKEPAEQSENDDREIIDEALDAAGAAENESTSDVPDTPHKEDFPEAIWQVADMLYDEIDDVQRSNFDSRAELNLTNDLGYGPVLLTESVKELTKVHLRSSFTKFDLVFMAIAVIVAIKIGSTDPYEYYDE